MCFAKIHLHISRLYPFVVYFQKRIFNVILCAHVYYLQWSTVFTLKLLVVLISFKIKQIHVYIEQEYGATSVIFSYTFGSCNALIPQGVIICWQVMYWARSWLSYVVSCIGLWFHGLNSDVTVMESFTP